ncbi:MAG: substrate-binding domain-containing protein [Flavobacteriales bacterium]|nr:MAG: substrate-binding domain-containing protein [Flavobacteriales bacterium]
MSSNAEGMDRRSALAGRGLVTCWLLFLLAACDTTPSNPRTDDNPTSGHVVVLVDEGLKPVFEDLESIFEHFYKDADLDLRYLPEGGILTAMQHDSVRLVFATFAPGADQDAYLRSKQITPHIETVATDAVAVIANKTVTESRIGVSEIRAQLTTGVPAEPWSGYRLLFDRNGSGVARTVIDSLLGGDASLMKAQVFSTNGIDSLVAQVARNPNTLGFIPFAAIADKDNAHSRHLLEQVKVLAVGRDTSHAVLPSQTTLADGTYPLCRPVVMLVLEPKAGLGTGFASFVAGHKGQRIILKRGLAPAHIPSREIEVVLE